MNDNIATIEKRKISLLNNSDKAEISMAFKNASSFKEIGERITAPFDSIIDQTSRIIDNDPIMHVSEELNEINDGVQEIYSEIINNDGKLKKFAKRIPLLWNITKKIDNKIENTRFNMQTITGKIETIFSGFDQSNSSLQLSVELQKAFLESISENIGRINEYKIFLEEKLEEFKESTLQTVEPHEKLKYEMFSKNISYFIDNLTVLTWNLEMAEKRLLMRLDSATKLSMAMSTSRPIFKTLLSTAMIENSSQNAIDASMRTLTAIGGTIDRMSTDLTDRAISSAKKSEELSNGTVLSTEVFVNNVKKLKTHFADIEKWRNDLELKSKENKIAFERSRTELVNIKLLTSQWHDEFEKILTENSNNKLINK